MRLLFFGILSVGLALPLPAQSPDTGEGPDPAAPRAQPAGDLGDPGASQDAEAAREKLLKAADQIDNIESNSETTKASIDGMKSDLAKLSDDNTALKAQVSTLQDTITKQQDQLDQIQADRAKERQALIDEVSSLVAVKGAAHHPHAADDAAAPRKHVTDDDTTRAAKPDAASLTPPTDAPAPASPPPTANSTPSTPAVATADPVPATPPATPKPHKGYYHVVAPHETLSLICEAFRDHGVNVTVAQVRHANGLAAGRPLKVGQKLFIPKPGA